ncbi:MFS transporter [Eggerthellaceae bacterium 3-80]
MGTRKPAAILFVAAFAAFLATFNETFLNVGFAPIMESLSVDVSTVQWLTTAYMLGAAVMVPVSAFAYRSFPTRPLFCSTAALLVIGSIIGGIANNFAILLIGRIVQALGTGMLIPIGMNITLEVAPREKLGTYMGIMGAMTTLGPSSSVILAGVILAVADWHMLLWVFAVNMLSLITIFAMNIIVPTFMQSVLGAPPLVASLTLFPAILCSCVASPLAGRVYDKHGASILLPVGFACIAIFSVLTAVFIATASPVLLAVIYIPVICGSALIIGPVQSFALSRLTPEMNPHGVTVMSTGFQIAGCFGSSVFTGVYAAVGAGALAAGISSTQAAANGMLWSGVLVGVFAVVGFCLALWLGKVSVRRPFASTADKLNEATGAPRESAANMVVSAQSPSANSTTALGTIMKTDVYTIHENATVLDALELFSAKGVSGVPVIDEDSRVVGFISDGDIMRLLADQVPAFKSAWSFIVEQENEDFDATVKQALQTSVSEIAVRKVVTVNLNDDLGMIARILAEHHVRKAPVLEGDVMVGIINRSNITKFAIESYMQG